MTFKTVKLVRKLMYEGKLNMHWSYIKLANNHMNSAIKFHISCQLTVRSAWYSTINDHPSAHKPKKIEKSLCPCIQARSFAIQKYVWQYSVPVTDTNQRNETGEEKPATVFRLVAVVWNAQALFCGSINSSSSSLENGSMLANSLLYIIKLLWRCWIDP